jgi:transposase
MSMSRNSVQLLQLPPTSPDLNPIENVWAILSRRVFSNNTFYGSPAILLAAVRWKWEALVGDRRLLERLADSMHRRCEQIIWARGGRATK